MTDREDLEKLAARMAERGANVVFGYIDGRMLTARITGAAGIGTHVMPLLSAAERMREWLSERVA